MKKPRQFCYNQTQGKWQNFLYAKIIKTKGASNERNLDKAMG